MKNSIVLLLVQAVTLVVVLLLGSASVNYMLVVFGLSAIPLFWGMALSLITGGLPILLAIVVKILELSGALEAWGII